jgi:hypothetical protein
LRDLTLTIYPRSASCPLYPHLEVDIWKWPQTFNEQWPLAGDTRSGLESYRKKWALEHMRELPEMRALRVMTVDSGEDEILFNPRMHWQQESENLRS